MSGFVRIDLPRRRADHAHADRVLQPHRAAEGEDHLPLLQVVGVGELQGGQALDVDLQHRQVGQPVHADQLGFHARRDSFLFWRIFGVPSLAGACESAGRLP